MLTEKIRLFVFLMFVWRVADGVPLISLKSNGAVNVDAAVLTSQDDTLETIKEVFAQLDVDENNVIDHMDRFYIYGHLDEFDDVLPEVIELIGDNSNGIVTIKDIIDLYVDLGLLQLDV
ncbi:uncharacterized protein LOC131935068 [Physella acuta]|uniref:uncharacterized protein LOC131935068 n=1 Tax=Physella acuta TaxID=109671 RepID=UPI0027DACF36|nr:uncharacterized protein LOC131935068 [Physella acuta]